MGVKSSTLVSKGVCARASLHVPEAGAAVLRRHGGAQQPELAEFGHDVAVKFLVAVGVEHAREEVLLACTCGLEACALE